MSSHNDIAATMASTRLLTDNTLSMRGQKWLLGSCRGRSWDGLKVAMVLLVPLTY